MNQRFICFFNHEMEQIVIHFTNVQEQMVYGELWKTFDTIYLRAYIGLLLLAGVYKSNYESLPSLWDDIKGRHIFWATISLRRFQNITSVMRSNDRLTRNKRRCRDKLAPIRQLWDKWESNIRRMFHPYENITIDEQLLPFRGC